MKPHRYEMNTSEAVSDKCRREKPISLFLYECPEIHEAYIYTAYVYVHACHVLN